MCCFRDMLAICGIMSQPHIVVSNSLYHPLASSTRRRSSRDISPCRVVCGVQMSSRSCYKVDDPAVDVPCGAACPWNDASGAPLPARDVDPNASVRKWVNQLQVLSCCAWNFSRALILIAYWKAGFHGGIRPRFLSRSKMERSKVKHLMN